MIQAAEERPMYVPESIWSKLVRMEGSEKFRAKSEQMKHANACRRSKGHTGPLGEVGVRERLRHQLGRSPEPEEVYDEMSGDKGYSGQRKSVGRALCPPKSNVAGASRLPSLRKEPSPESDDPSPVSAVDPCLQCRTAVHNSPPPTASHINTVSESTTPTISLVPNVNRVFVLITNQIADVQNSVVGATEDGQALIAALELQFSTLRQRDQASDQDLRDHVTAPREFGAEDTHVEDAPADVVEAAHSRKVRHYILASIAFGCSVF